MSHEISLLEKALQASPSNWPVRRSLATQHSQAGNAAEAAKLLLEAPEIPAGEKDQVFAAQLIAETNPAKAHEMLDVFLEENAASGQGHLLKGRLHRAEGDKEKAESHFKVAAILDPSIDIEAELAMAKDESVAVVEVKEEEEDKMALTSAVAAVTALEESTGSVESTRAAEDVAAEEEPPVVVPAPVPLTPKPLAPPPAAETKKDEAKPAEAAAVVAAVPEIPPAKPSTPAVAATPVESVAVALEDDDADAQVAEIYNEDGEYVGEEHHSGERAFIVGEGEMVHAHEKNPDSKEKLSAVVVAVLVHVAILFLLGLVGLAMPRPNPPQITASAVADNGEESLDNKTVTKMQQRTASAVTSAQPVVSVESFSAVAIPDMPDMTADLTMVSISDGDTGLGMSMSGFGDVSNMGAIPPAMRSRCSMSQRMQRLRESGGEDRAEKAVRNALEWLAKQQNENGSFGEKYYCAMTGLSLLAYLGHCETPESPKFGEAVVGSALYLMEVAKKKDGYMWNGEGGNHKSYEHAIATYALCELYTMTKESGRPVPGLESVLRRSVDHIVDGQTDFGGWAYGYAQNNRDDMSVAGWQIQALKAAHNTGKKFPGVDKALDKSMAYLKKIQDQAGAFKYTPDNPTGKPTLTGAALLGMQIWDEMGSAEYKKGMSYLSQKYANPTPGTNFYAPYYNTQAFFLHGGKEWEDYNGKFQAKLLDAQNPDGSWTKPGVGGHGAEDSHIMNTAWGCLMLEVYYRYLPTTDKVEGLKAK
ncbi:MAG: hypothetical protein KDN20_16410 [Verrucomicrobiae bacterium]|nr:hypothetical protein [Verrucomicrobiae bacterium]